MTDNIELPPLPILPQPDVYDPGRFGTAWGDVKVTDYAKDYARAAILADRRTRQAPAPVEVSRLAEELAEEIKTAWGRQDNVRLYNATDRLRDLAFRAFNPAPIDMVLHCPACGLQHIDAPENMAPKDQPELNAAWGAWENPPHRSHLCHGCGHIWRPADVPTNGVSAIKTAGSADSPLASTPVGEVPAGRLTEVTKFDQRVIDLQEKAFMPYAQALELAASEFSDVLCWVHEWGAIGLPLGHPSRVTCFKAFNTLAEAVEDAAGCEFNDRILPVFQPSECGLIDYPSDRRTHIAASPAPAASKGAEAVDEDRFHCPKCKHGWNAIDETECPRDECPNCGFDPIIDRLSAPSEPEAQKAVAREQCAECSTPTHCKSFGYENCAYSKCEQSPAASMEKATLMNTRRSQQSALDELRREVEAWKAVVWAVARELNCLPSTFSDGNAHVLRAAIKQTGEVEALRADRDRLDWLGRQHKETVEIFSFERWRANELRYVRCWVIDKAPAEDTLRAAIDTARASTDEAKG